MLVDAVANTSPVAIARSFQPSGSQSHPAANEDEAVILRALDSQPKSHNSIRSNYLGGTDQGNQLDYIA